MSGWYHKHFTGISINLWFWDACKPASFYMVRPVCIINSVVSLISWLIEQKPIEKKLDNTKWDRTDGIFQVDIPTTSVHLHRSDGASLCALAVTVRHSVTRPSFNDALFFFIFLRGLGTKHMGYLLYMHTYHL